MTHFHSAPYLVMYVSRSDTYVSLVAVAMRFQV